MKRAQSKQLHKPVVFLSYGLGKHSTAAAAVELIENPQRRDADVATLKTGARHNPELLARYVEIEKRGGKTFQPGRALATLDLSEPAP